MASTTLLRLHVISITSETNYPCLLGQGSLSCTWTVLSNSWKQRFIHLYPLHAVYAGGTRQVGSLRASMDYCVRLRWTHRQDNDTQAIALWQLTDLRQLSTSPPPERLKHSTLLEKTAVSKWVKLKWHSIRSSSLVSSHLTHACEHVVIKPRAWLSGAFSEFILARMTAKGHSVPSGLQTNGLRTVTCSRIL